MKAGLFLLLVLAVLVAITLVRRHRVLAQARELHKLNRERQDFIISVMDEMQKVEEDRSLDIEEAQARFDVLLAQLVAIDHDGVLEPLIRDNQAWFAEQMAKRKAE